MVGLDLETIQLNVAKDIYYLNESEDQNSIKTVPNLRSKMDDLTKAQLGLVVVLRQLSSNSALENTCHIVRECIKCLPQKTVRSRKRDGRDMAAKNSRFVGLGS